MVSRKSQPGRNRIGALPLAFLLTLVFIGFSFLPPVSENPSLAHAFWEAGAVLLVFLYLLRRAVARQGRTLTYRFLPVKVHYVQMAMHSCIYAYWGWYWREVYHHIPLIVAQIVFVYVLDMLVCWSRRDQWILGFGPFPIVLSTNLFLWFRDDWFFLQFLMIATGVLCKEFIKWRREGEDREVHIFNPSAIALFIFSIGLLITQSTPITWGQEIATTLHRPPQIYLEIFLIGLVVQSLFSVTLVTLAAAGALYVLNLAFTSSIGTYHFIDSNIPISVFLGLHLLVTDPATSPRTTWGKVIFGGLYGAGVFALYGFLGWIDAPRFYDKLLCVPILNLGVQAFDRAGRVLSKRLDFLNFAPAWSPRKLNFAHMGIWIALFGFMAATGFVGHSHPGQSNAFWSKACQEGKWNACGTLVHNLKITCGLNSAGDCLALGLLLDEGRFVAKDPAEAGKSLGRACDLGQSQGCQTLVQFVLRDGGEVLRHSCDHADGPSCFILGSLYHNGSGIPKDDTRAIAFFRKSCADGWWRGCGRLGESYIWGEGTSVDTDKALENFEKACRGRHAPSCFNVALIYHRGVGGVKDESLAEQRLEQACEFGLPSACKAGETPAVSDASAVDRGGG